MIENKHQIAEMSIKDQLMKTEPDKAENFKFVSEWEMYDGVTTKSSLIKIIDDKDSLNLKTVNYLTYDSTNFKFVGITLEQQVRNIVVYDDLNEVMPKMVEDGLDLEAISSLKSVNETCLRLLMFAN